MSPGWGWPIVTISASPTDYSGVPPPQILSHLVMEELLPTLQTDLLPKMKGKKNDRKRAWLGVSDGFSLHLCYSKQAFFSLLSSALAFLQTSSFPGYRTAYLQSAQSHFNED